MSPSWGANILKRIYKLLSSVLFIFSLKNSSRELFALHIVYNFFHLVYVERNKRNSDSQKLAVKKLHLKLQISLHLERQIFTEKYFIIERH
jgi:hypothetical protein